MAKSKKIIKDNTDCSARAKQDSWWGEYQDMITLRVTPVSNHYLEQLAIEMVQWFEAHPDAKRLTDFYETKRLYEKTLSEWRKRSPVLEKAVEYCKMILGNRREEWAITHPTYNAGTLQKVMTYYSTAWKEDAEWKAKLNDEALNTGAKIIVMPQYPKTDIVPERK